MERIAMITGATSGIGQACARLLAQEGYQLIVTGRRADRLEALATELRQQHRCQVYTACFDVRQLHQVEQAVAQLPAQWRTIDVLINNAGLAVGLTPLHEGVVDDWERMIDTNVKGLLYVSRAVIPLLRGSGSTIVNLGSIAAKEVYAKGNVYCATKHAVDALTQGMRIDLLERGIRVGAIHPGMVDTEFSLVRFKGDQQAADKVYADLTPLYAEDIAQAVLFMVSRPAHVTINDLVIMPTVQANTTHTVRRRMKD